MNESHEEWCNCKALTGNEIQYSPKDYKKALETIQIMSELLYNYASGKDDGSAIKRHVLESIANI